MQVQPRIYFSQFVGVSSKSVDDYGAFDISLVNDLPLFVDPFLLFNSEETTYQDLHAGIIRYMLFLKEESLGGTLSPPLVDAWFTFKEVKQNWLGFSRTGNSGRGLGREFAISLHRNFSAVFSNFGEEQITKSSHLEKLCLIRDGVGRDAISDFTTNLIKEFLAGYTQAFARKHIAPAFLRRIQLPKVRFNYETKSWITREFELPYVNGDFVLLTPKNMLTRDESWINRPELLDSVRSIAESMPDPQLRAQINQYLLKALPVGSKTTQADRQEANSKVLEKFPLLLDYYILRKEDKASEASSVASQRVAFVQAQLVDEIRRFVAEVLVPEGFYSVNGNTREEAIQRLAFLKDVVENKGGHRIFYVKGKPIEREEDLQILYRLTWHASTSDVSREANDGRGPADFKISRGAKDKVIVEFKLAKNTQLERNLQRQTAIYEKASDTTHASVKAILYFSYAEYLRVVRILKKLKLETSPDIVLIDARSDNKPSGSKA
jgi:hypothetical protein